LSPETTPAPSTEAILQIAPRGGLVGLDVYHTQLPAFVLLTDGRVIRPGTPTDIYSGPALPTAQVH
jgi:hypothetical protein